MECCFTSVTTPFNALTVTDSLIAAHIWDNIEAGMLHRAFSVFLFTPDGKLVLQQRSGAKITFPYIWANTCCSHPLHVPSERITKDAMGVKNAARRKLEHELGIPPEDVPLECFTWITRVHYVGASEDNKTAKGGKKVRNMLGSDVRACRLIALRTLSAFYMSTQNTHYAGCTCVGRA